MFDDHGYRDSDADGDNDDDEVVDVAGAMGYLSIRVAVDDHVKDSGGESLSYLPHG